MPTGVASQGAANHSESRTCASATATTDVTSPSAFTGMTNRDEPPAASDASGTNPWLTTTAGLPDAVTVTRTRTRRTGAVPRLETTPEMRRGAFGGVPPGFCGTAVRATVTELVSSSGTGSHRGTLGERASTATVMELSSVTAAIERRMIDSIGTAIARVVKFVGTGNTQSRVFQHGAKRASA